MEQLSASDLLRAKQSALQMARELNPNTKQYQNQTGIGNQQTETVPPVEKVLNCAKIIYEWLIAK